MREFTADDVHAMRAMRRAGLSMVEVKRRFRDRGFTEDQTITLYWLQVNATDIAEAVLEANAIGRGHAFGFCARPVRIAWP